MVEHRHLIAVPGPGDASAIERLLAARPAAAGGCPGRVDELVPGLTAALVLQWGLVDEQLHLLVPDTTYQIWLAPLRLHHFGDVEVRVAAPPPIASWIRDRYVRVLDRAVSEVAGGPRRVVVEICETCPPQHSGASS